MKRCFLLLLGTLGCASESGRVRDARDAFYAAISSFDDVAIRAATIPDYLSVDRGRFFNIDSLVADVTLLEQESLTVQYAFLDSAVKIDPPMAWAVYRSRRVISRPQFADTSYAVESATFQRDGSGWKVVLVHRTPVTGGEGFFSGTTPSPLGSPSAPAGSAAAPAGAAGSARVPGGAQ
jgi:hypothetical protein